MRERLAGGRLIGIRSLLITATVLAVMLPSGVSTAIPEPARLNIENLVPGTPKPNYEREVLEPLQNAQKAAKSAAERKVPSGSLERLEAVESPSSVVQGAQAPSGNCYEAVRATWPRQLWPGAYTVMEKESGARSQAIGKINSNGSQDFGCFQINNFAHRGFFQSHDWADSYQNAAYAYTIYRGRGNWSAWYAVRGLLW